MKFVEKCEPKHAAEALENWHNEHHEGVFAWCYEEPCKSAFGSAPGARLTW